MIHFKFFLWLFLDPSFEFINWNCYNAATLRLNVVSIRLLYKFDDNIFQTTWVYQIYCCAPQQCTIKMSKNAYMDGGIVVGSAALGRCSAFQQQQKSSFHCLIRSQCLLLLKFAFFSSFLFICFMLLSTTSIWAFTFRLNAVWSTSFVRSAR